MFTNPEELAARNERRDREREWRKQRGEDESDESDEEGSEEEEEGTSSDEGGDKESKAKGVEALIEIENPNRAPPKPVKKAAATTVQPDAPVEVQLSRREREELEKQRARDAYNKLHAEGKTEQARADLARLALIRQQREEAAKKKEQEKMAKEGSAKAAAVSKVAATKSAVTAVTAVPGADGDGASGGAKKKTSKK